MSNAVYKNQAVISPSFDAEVKCGTGLVLGATNDLPIPVGYDLGVDVYDSIATGGVLVVTGDNVASLGNGTSSNGVLRIYTTDIVVGGIYSLDFTATNITGSPYAYGYLDGEVLVPFDSPILITDGVNHLEIKHRYTDRIQLYMSADVAWDYDMTEISVKQITTTGYLTYETDDGVVQLEAGVDLPNSTTYTLADDTYRWAYVNENPFSEADLAAIEANPNKIVEFAMDGTGLTNTQGVDDKFYAMTEYSS